MTSYEVMVYFCILLIGNLVKRFYCSFTVSKYLAALVIISINDYRRPFIPYYKHNASSCKVGNVPFRTQCNS